MAKGRTRRLAAGRYIYEVAGRRYALVEVGKSEGGPRALWVVSLVTGPSDYHIGAPFDAAETLAGAKAWADVDAGRETARGKPLIEVL
jgi:hypothetical protein